MLNQIILVGRIVEIKKDGIKISIPRSFKNIEGKYENDIVDIKLFDTISKNANEYCKKGDLVGIKGKVQNLNGENNLEVVAEKVTFLSSRKEND